MSTDYFAELPPELISLLPPFLSASSLSALVLICRRLHDILRPELEAHITPGFRRHLLLKAAAGEPELVAKLLASRYSADLSDGYDDRTPLHVAVNAGHCGIAKLLLDAGADITARWRSRGLQALHIAVCNADLEMMKLLLDYGAPVDEAFGEHRDLDASPLHHACAIGHLEIVQLLLDRGADIEYQCALGSALGFAVQSGQPNVVKLLLNRGANAAGSWRLRSSQRVTLLYVAMGIRNPALQQNFVPMGRNDGREPTPWTGLPLGEPRKQLMALLLANGASKATTLTTIRQNLSALAKEAKHTEDGYLATILAMLKEAEAAVPDVLAMYE